MMKWINVYDIDAERIEVECPICGYKNIFIDGAADDWCEHLAKEDYMTMERGPFGNYLSIYFVDEKEEE